MNEEKIKSLIELNKILNMPDTRLKIDLEIGDTIKLSNEIKTVILKVIPGSCKNCYCYNIQKEVCDFRTNCKNKIFTLISENLKKNT